MWNLKFYQVLQAEIRYPLENKFQERVTTFYHNSCALTGHGYRCGEIIIVLGVNLANINMRLIQLLLILDQFGILHVLSTPPDLETCVPPDTKSLDYPP